MQTNTLYRVKIISITDYPDEWFEGSILCAMLLLQNDRSSRAFGISYTMVEPCAKP